MSFSTLLHAAAALSCSTLRAAQQKKPCRNERGKKKRETTDGRRENCNLRMHRVQCWYLRPHSRRLCDFSVFHLGLAESGTTNFHALCCFMNPLKWVCVEGARSSLTSNFYSKCCGLNSPFYRGSSGFSAGLRGVPRGKKHSLSTYSSFARSQNATCCAGVFVKDIMLPKGSKMEWNLSRLAPRRVSPAQASGPNTTQ